MAEKELEVITLKKILTNLKVSDDLISKLSDELLNVPFLDIYEDYRVDENMLIVTGINDNILEINLKDSTLTQYEVVEGPVRERHYNKLGLDSSLIFKV